MLVMCRARKTISIAYGDVECMPDEELVRVPKTYLNVNRILECSNSCIMSPGIFANLSDLLAGSVVDCDLTLLAGRANASTETSERVYGTKDPDAPELLGKMSMLSVKPVPIPVVISLVWKSRSLVFQFLLLVQWVEDDFHDIPPLRNETSVPVLDLHEEQQKFWDPRIRRQYFSLKDMLVIFHSLRGSVIGCRFHRDLASAPAMSLVWMRILQNCKVSVKLPLVRCTFPLLPLPCGAPSATLRYASKTCFTALLSGNSPSPPSCVEDRG
ncbi:hypothetical protein GGU11DRAFT_210450 [Lentinula aff. detonsa]|nr:hypothetical protein GGU11DRAFT_210450 [Lentinula aff. detonsa]